MKNKNTIEFHDTPLINVPLFLTESPIVSIIIPVYNNFDYTQNCLQSISDNASDDIDLEIIVVDDASTDKTEESLKRISGIHVIRNNANIGFIASCNYGALNAKGKFLYFLNNDTKILPKTIETLLSLIEANDTVGAVGSKLIYPDGRLQEAGGIIWQDGSGWNYGRLNNPEQPSYNYVREVDYCSAASLLVRHELFEKLGGFSKEFTPAYYEDTDLCFRIRQMGYKVLYQPKSVVIHYEGITSGTSIESGVKKHQKINQSTFKAKWNQILKNHLLPDSRNVEFGSRRLLLRCKTILIIDSYVPIYDQESGSCRIFNIIKLLIGIGYFVIFLPDNGEKIEPYASELQELGVEVLYRTPQQPDIQEQLNKYLVYLDIAWICRPSLCDKYLNIFKQEQKIQIIYDTVDLHFLRLKREWELFSSDNHATENWQNIQNLELKLAEAADVTVTVTELEKNILMGFGINNVSVIPNIHDSYSETFKDFEQRSGLLFIGGYNHPPNVDAVIWLVMDIMPHLWKLNPDIKLTLLGANPPENIKNLANDKITVTGYVKDVEPYFLNSRVFVAPLRFGAGMKGKIGQSMSYGLPTVTTQIGAEGMGLMHGFDVIVSDDTEELAQHIFNLYTNSELWNYVSNNAINTVKLYSSNSVQSLLKNLLNSLDNYSLPPESKFLNYKLKLSQQEFQDCQIQLQNHKIYLQDCQDKLQVYQEKLQALSNALELEEARNIHNISQLEIAKIRIIAMETSKFWKMRKVWFKIKGKFGLKVNE